MKKAVMICGASVLLLWTVSGCQSDKKDCCATTQAANIDGAAFYAQGDTTTTQKFLSAQAASGARADSTFNAIHFDGGKLNSLGTAKVDAMLADDDTAEPVVFYLNMNEGDAFKTERQDAIVAYCKTRGMTETQVQFKLGPNPATYSPSADILSRMNKTESGGAGATGGSTEGSTGMSTKSQ
jgi:hypothetical protein